MAVAKTVLLILLAHASATVDAWSTRRAQSHYQAREQNPLARPFVHSNTLYATVQIPVVINDVLLLRSRKRRVMLRDLEIAQAALHAGATAWNNAWMSEHRKVRWR